MRYNPKNGSLTTEFTENIAIILGKEVKHRGTELKSRDKSGMHFSPQWLNKIIIQHIVLSVPSVFSVVNAF